MRPSVILFLLAPGLKCAHITSLVIHCAGEHCPGVHCAGAQLQRACEAEGCERQNQVKSADVVKLGVDEPILLVFEILLS